MQDAGSPSLRALADTLARWCEVLRRRPATAREADKPALAQWQGGTRMRTMHPNGHTLATEMPAALAGSDDAVTPGWLFRAGLASCAATSIVFAAAQQGVALHTLQVQAGSESDARGLFGLHDEAGSAVDAAPLALALVVQLGATGVSAERLRTLVHEALVRSPVPQLAGRALPLAVSVEVV